MKKIIIIILAITFTSCNSNSLKKEFDCVTNTNFSELKEHRDFLKNFRIKIPKSWKTTHYYDEYSAEIYSADTTKQLTETIILEMAWRQGELNLDTDFAKKINDTIQQRELLKLTKEGYGTFKEKPMYYNLSEGYRSGISYHYLQVYLKTNIDEYIMLTSKIFGNKLTEERICESVELFETLELIE